MLTEDAYSSGHLVLSHFGTCMCSYVETNLSWTCLVSGLLNFEHPSVVLFCLWVQHFCSFTYWEAWNSLNRFYNASWVVVYTPTDRPNSVRFNRCVIEVFGGVFDLSLCVFEFFNVGVRAFVVGLRQISLFPIFKFCLYFVCLLITDERSIPEMLVGCIL